MRASFASLASSAAAPAFCAIGDQRLGLVSSVSLDDHRSNVRHLERRGKLFERVRPGLHQEHQPAAVFEGRARRVSREAIRGAYEDRAGLIAIG